MNETLENILEIYRFVMQKNYELDNAVAAVGKKKNLDKIELLSTCMNELKINSDVFNNFLETEDPFNFKNFLVRRFPSDHNKITRFFNSFEDVGDIPIIDLTKIIKSSSRTDNKYVSSTAMMSSLKEDFQDWIGRHDVPQDIKDVMKDWLLKMEDQNI